jgi:hypothetical protein
MVPLQHINYVKDKLQSKITFEPNTGCWLWLGATNGKKNYPSLTDEEINKIRIDKRRTIEIALNYKISTRYVLQLKQGVRRKVVTA